MRLDRRPTPIWSSRPSHDGIVASYTVRMWQLNLIAVIVLTNIVLWGALGVIAFFAIGAGVIAGLL